MRREYLQEQCLPSGCIFYAPLTQGDLTDHVSGVTPTTETNCTCEWDSGSGAYNLYSRQVKKAPLLYSGLTRFSYSDFISNGGYTISMCFRQDEYVGNKYAAWFSLNGVRSTNVNYHNYICQARYELDDSYFNSWHRITLVNCKVSGTQSNNYYYDGTLKNAQAWNLPEAGATNPQLLTICELHANNTSMRIHAKNIVVFNRPLSVAEIQELNQLDV